MNTAYCSRLFVYLIHKIIKKTLKDWELSVLLYRKAQVFDVAEA
jgi:hypothetical protein